MHFIKKPCELYVQYIFISGWELPTIQQPAVFIIELFLINIMLQQSKSLLLIDVPFKKKLYETITFSLKCCFYQKLSKNATYVSFNVYNV